MVDDNETYLFGDAAAAREVKLPTAQLRKLRLKGKLQGAVAKFGHRSTVYHRDRLKRRVDEVFRNSA
ncbi:MAG: hypothetical protein AUI16_01010 [Alphaproteobacteria bacterium 13_2_20CM_2_64_7]|jgi:hypothetical protein|nr:MAG: hypothetical protein AUI16_01010 [Alphaproteobacteria bacterium 13_2_20CM_2_64_7]